MTIRPFAAVAFLAVAAAACADGPAAPARDRSARDVALVGGRADVVQDAPQLGGEPIVLRFRSIEDPAFPPDRSVCADAGFTTNVFLGASLWTLPLFLVLFHYAMVFRGLLFEALASGNSARRAAWISQLRP